jgi:hypothetical protein
VSGGHTPRSESSNGNFGKQNAWLIAPDRRRGVELSDNSRNSFTGNDRVDAWVKHG